jgi:hypothetical protein
MRFDGETVPAGSIAVDVKEASEYGWLPAFRFADLMALGIAAMFAIISGLGTYYFTAPAFGSVTDYVTLFLWGAGIDQTKNFLQHLGSKES